jgi:predicted PurR-regulated permease PerM
VVLATLAIFHTLRVGADLFMPIALALLGCFTLNPILRRLARRGVPPLLGASVVVAILVATAVASVATLSQPTLDWMERAPGILREVGREIRLVQEPMADVVAATKEVEDAALGDEDRVVVEEPGLLDGALELTQSLALQGILAVALLFFLLAAGEQLERVCTLALSRARGDADARDLFVRIETDVSRYLLTITCINFCLGAVVALAMWLMSMPSPILWGVMAGVANFVPFLGPSLMAVVLSVVSLITFDAFLPALGVTAVFVFLTGVEGLLITPALLGRRLLLSPVAIFVSVLTGSWLWGLPGAIVAVPLLAAFRIGCAVIAPSGWLDQLMGGGTSSSEPARDRPGLGAASEPDPSEQRA